MKEERIHLTIKLQQIKTYFIVVLIFSIIENMVFLETSKLKT